MRIRTPEKRAQEAVAYAKSRPEVTYQWAVKLRALPDDATPEQVNTAVGHQEQTRVRCDECGIDQTMIVEVGEEPSMESSTASLCLLCARNALRLIEGHS